MAKAYELNYFRFIAILLAGIIVPHILNIPDIDQNILSPLGHRSIITHSILFPYLMHHFLINKKNQPNSDFIIFIIGFYLSVAMHLSADLYPKGWRGYAFIKLPGNISIGEGPSVIWMFLNIIVGTYFSSKLLINIADTKKHIISYLIITAIISIFYASIDGGDVGPKFITFLIVLLITFFVAKKRSGRKGIELTKPLTKKKEKKTKKKSGNMTAIIVAMGVVLVLGFLIFVLGNPQTTSERKMKQEKQSNYRAYDVYTDELNMCNGFAKAKFSEKKFTKYFWESYTADKNKKTYTKKIKMWMNYDGLIRKNKVFKYVDCHILVKPDQTITFLGISDKY